MQFDLDLEYIDYTQLSQPLTFNKQISLEVLLVNGNTQEQIIIPNVQTNVYDDKSFNLTEVLQSLEFRNYSIKESSIYLFEHNSQMYIPCGKYPFFNEQLFKYNPFNTQIIIEYTPIKQKVDFQEPVSTYLHEVEYFNPIQQQSNFDFLNDTVSDYNQDSGDNNNSLMTDLFGSNQNSDCDFTPEFDLNISRDSNSCFNSHFDDAKNISKINRSAFSTTNEFESSFDELMSSISSKKNASLNTTNFDNQIRKEISLISKIDKKINLVQLQRKKSIEEKRPVDFFTLSQTKPKKKVMKLFSLPSSKRRPKERTIKAVMNAVFTWRIIFTKGRQSSDGRRQKSKKYSLGQAATKVGYSKKSLDDYLLQIRYGAKFGFDFEVHKNEKIGKLRAFVRKEKKKALQKNKNEKNEDKRTYLKSLPFTTTSLTTEMISLLTDLKPVKKQK